MQIDGLFAAKPQPFGPRGAPSSIIKLPVDTLTVAIDGTSEDEQGNKKLHGGPEKVMHQYGANYYQILIDNYPGAAPMFVPGSIGENIVVDGMDDKNVYVGDIYQMGEVKAQVSAPRAPCNKISQRFGQKNMDRFVGKLGITGWYYRVLETGKLTMNAPVSLVERAEKTVSIHALVAAIYAEQPDYAALLAFSKLAVLDDEWREKCARKA